MWGYIGIPIMIIGGIIYLLWKWKSEAQNSVKVKILRTSGNWDTYIVEDKDGTIEVPKDKKNPKKGGWTWKMSDIHHGNDVYPGKYIPTFLQASIRMVAVNEWDVEPMSKKTNTNVEFPNLIYNLEHEKVTSLIISVFEQVEELQAKLQKAVTSYLNPRLVYGGLVLAILASGYCVYTVMELVKQNEILMKAYGLG